MIRDPAHAESAEAPLAFRPIGRIRTPFLSAAGTPIQAVYAHGVEGRVIVDPPYEAALADIEGFERIWLIYWLDRAAPFQPLVTPYRDTKQHGLFATRSPCRPNPIGLSLVRLQGRIGPELTIVDVDLLDNTPLLDIKPYVPEFDARPDSRAGWFENAGVDRQTADDRFHPDGTGR